MKKLFTLFALAAAFVPAGAKTIWTGNCTFAGYAVESGERPVFKPADFADATVGDKLVFSVTDYTADSESWHQVELWHYDSEKPYQSSLCQGIQVLPATTKVEFTLDEDLLAALKSGETCAAGTGYTVTSVDLATFDGIVWSGNMTAGNWAQSLTIPAANFIGIKAGDKLEFTVSTATADGQICLKQNLPQGWAEMPSDAGEWGNYIHLNEGDGVYSFDVNAQAAASIKEYGLVVAGSGFTLTKVAYAVTPSGITDIYMNEKLPSAVYDLRGVKVADSLDEVTAPGLYISGGKKYILK